MGPNPWEVAVDGLDLMSDGAAAEKANVQQPVQRGVRIFGLPLRQLIKVVVYSLLLVNFVHYLSNDITVMRHAVHDGWKIVDWTSAFATTMDESAWFVLLLLFELETYLLSDEAFTRGGHADDRCETGLLPFLGPHGLRLRRRDLEAIQRL